MRKFLLGLAMVLSLTVAVNAADDLTDKVKANPNDAKVLNEFLGQRFQAIAGQMNEAPDEASKQLDELKKFVESLEITEAQAKNLAKRADAAITFYREQVELAKTPLEDIVAKLKENPNDAKSIQQLTTKVINKAAALANSSPDEADAVLKPIRAIMAEVKKGATESDAKQAVTQFDRMVSRLDQSIAQGRKYTELVGKESPEIEAAAWVNGEPLSPSDLKGKVVLLDFWAVWCGPCIATFPHLREWQEEYGEQGLVIIGLTQYYNYAWDDAAGRAQRSQSKVSPEEEHAMLQRFAKEHDLHHVFGVTTDRKLAEFFGVRGIPQAVVIDREGKVQLIRVGSGEANAKAIGDKIKELIEQS